MRCTFVITMLLVSLSRPAAQTPAAACATLAGRTLPNTTITTAQEVTGGSFTQPGTANVMPNLPPFCRVTGTIAPFSS